MLMHAPGEFQQELHFLLQLQVNHAWPPALTDNILEVIRMQKWLVTSKVNLDFNDYYLYQGDTELFKVSYIYKSTLHMFNGQSASTQIVQDMGTKVELAKSTQYSKIVTVSI
jgi:hypothetical protein